MHTVKVLGSGCANCERLTTLTTEALQELGRSEQVEKVTDYAAIAALGVMATIGAIPVLRTAKQVAWPGATCWSQSSALTGTPLAETLPATMMAT